MSKPSLMQAMLNRPSQSYSFPQEKEYFSTKNTMIRLAAESTAAHRPHTDTSSASSSSTSRDKPKESLRYGLRTAAHALESTPPASIHSVSSRAASVRDQDRALANELNRPKSPSSGSRSAITKSQNPPSTIRTIKKRTSSSSRRSQPLPDNFDDPSDSDSSQDVWFTPRTSPRTSMASSVATIPFPSPTTARSNLPPTKPPRSSSKSQGKPSKHQPTDLPSTSSLHTFSSASPASTITSTSIGGHSSSLPPDPLSDTTVTPVQSDEGHGGAPQHESHEPVSKVSPQKRLAPTTDPSATVVKSTITRRPPPSYSVKRSLLSDIDRGIKDQHQATPNPSHEEDILDIPAAFLSLIDRGDPPPPPRSSYPSRPRAYPTQDAVHDLPTSRRSKKSASKATHNIMVNMAALIEEDEETLSNQSRSIRSGQEGQYSSNTGNRVLLSTSDDRSIMEEDRRYHGSSNEETTLPQHVRHRRSRSLDYSPSQMTSTTFERKYVPPANLYGDPSTLPSHGTRGYTSLTLPRAPLPPSAALGLSPAFSVEGNMRLDGSGTVDLTRSGIAQTTMATVEVVRGLSRKSGKGWRVVKELFTKHATGGGEIELAFTSYRSPPKHIPARCILVQVWAVALDEVDVRLLGVGEGSPKPNTRQGPRPGQRTARRRGNPPEETTNTTRALLGKSAEVGYIPGRSFVGRVLECGWEVGEESMRRGDWIAGLLDARKCGGLAEFIVADRHRVHRVPHPDMGSQTKPLLDGHAYELDAATKAQGGTSQPSDQSIGSPRALSRTASAHINHTPSRTPSTRSTSTPSHTLRAAPSESPTPKPQQNMTLQELAALPLTAIPAYRAVRTFQFACASWSGQITGNPPIPTLNPSQAGSVSDIKRVVILRGHDGVGAMATQMLAEQGWRVSVHAPLPQATDTDDSEVQLDNSMRLIEERARLWGADEVIFDDGGYETESTAMKRTAPIVRVLRRLSEDGDVFDAVLDTVGGKEIWEASERLLAVIRPNGRYGQFTTLVGDSPERPLPTAGDHFRAGVRNWRMASNRTRKGSLGRSASLNTAQGSHLVNQANQQALQNGGAKGKGKVAYAWVSLAQDVDWEGEDVGESLGAVLRMALENGIRPYLGEANQGTNTRELRFDAVPEVVGNRNGSRYQLLRDGGCIVVKVVE